MVTATTPEGKRIVVALGCKDECFKNKFNKMLTDNKVNVDDILMLDYNSSLYTLRHSGGIACRVKPIS